MSNDSGPAYVLDGRTATPHFPGIGRYVRNLVAAMPAYLEQDERLYILSPNGEQPGPDHPRVCYVPAAPSPFSVQQQWQVPRLIRRSAPDARVYHSAYYLMPYRAGVPTVVTLHDLIGLVMPETVSPRARRFFKLTVWLALRAAQAVIVGATDTRTDLINHFNVPTERITVIPYAPAPRFQPQSSAAINAARTALDLPPQYLLYFGINKPHKNLVRLVEAHAKLPDSAPPLVIGGAWDERYPEAKQRAAALELGDRVRFIGRVDDEHLPALYAGSTLFVFPSLYEGFGLPVVEAMACGAPVICANSPGLRDAAGDAGLRVDPHNTELLAATIQRVLDDQDLRATLQARGLAHAQSLTWVGAAKATLDVYRNQLAASQ